MILKRKRKYYLALTQGEVRLALRALLSFRNKVIARGIDAVDVGGIIRKLSIRKYHKFRNEE